MSPELRIKQLHSEYENLRRKKNKEIDELKLRMSKGSTRFYNYLTETNQLERYYEWLNKIQKDSIG